MKLLKILYVLVTVLSMALPNTGRELSLNEFKKKF